MKLRIKEARERAGLSQKQLAEYLNIKPNTFSGYETGAHDPKSNILMEIAKLCNTTVDYLLCLVDNPNIDKGVRDQISFKERLLVEKYRQLDKYSQKAVDAVVAIELERCNCVKINTGVYNQPIKHYSTPYYDLPVSAGTGEFLDSEHYTIVELTEEPPRGANFMVRVSGDSMEPTYHDGDKLFIKQQHDVEIGEIGIFMIDGDVYVKELAEDGLISHNEKYSKIQFHEYNNIRCYGKVLGVCTEEI